MRYPETPIMWRVFDLFRNRLDLGDKLVPYIMTSENQFLHYNGRRVQQRDIDKAGIQDIHPDYFHDSEINGGMVPPDFIERGTAHWLSQCFDPFKKLFEQDFEKGWKQLMMFDEHSARSFMASSFDITEGDFVLKKEKYPFFAINWLERMNTGTGLFDMAFSEMVLDDLAFDYPAGALVKYGAEAPEMDWKWWCLKYVVQMLYIYRPFSLITILRGGSKVFIEEMYSKISNKPPKPPRRVTKIEPTLVPTCKPLLVTATIGATDGQPLTEHMEESKTSYDYVISTIPLGALRYVDMDTCNLSYAQWEGIRTLRYDSSCKVGIKFTCRWWEDSKFLPLGSIVGGQSKTDRVIRTVVFPSYGVCNPDADAVMIASYTWSQDAQRVGGLFSGQNRPAEELLINNILNDLAIIHDVPLEKLRELLLGWFAFDWNTDPFTLGEQSNIVAHISDLIHNIRCLRPLRPRSI
jgi:hypothetical protein